MLIIGVIGSIYMGLASPTEGRRRRGLPLACHCLGDGDDDAGYHARKPSSPPPQTSCMIIFILAGAAFLTTAMGFTGIPRVLAEWIGSFGLSQGMLLLALTVFFIIMGCFLDGISMVVLTTSIIMPLVVGAGFDLIWFGIYIVLVVEIGADHAAGRLQSLRPAITHWKRHLQARALHGAVLSDHVRGSLPARDVSRYRAVAAAYHAGGTLMRGD